MVVEDELNGFVETQNVNLELLCFFSPSGMKKKKMVNVVVVEAWMRTNSFLLLLEDSEEQNDTQQH